MVLTAATPEERYDELCRLGRDLMEATTDDAVERRDAAAFVAPQGSGLLFANSAVVPFLSELTSGGVTAPVAAQQKCLRGHNLRLWQDGSYSGEWLSVFEMIGAFAPDFEGGCELGGKFLRALPVPAGTSLLISAASRDELMARRLSDLLRPTFAVDIVLDESTPAHQVTWKSAYHDWSFGERQLTGSGLTVAMVHRDDGFRRDLGNLVEFAVEGRPISYGIGFGIETVFSALVQAPRLIDCLPEGLLVPSSTIAAVAWIDFLSGAVHAVAGGALPASRGPGSITRRMCSRARQVTFQHRLPRPVVEATIRRLVPFVSESVLLRAAGAPEPVDHERVTAVVLDEVFAPSAVCSYNFQFTVTGSPPDVSMAVESLDAAGLASNEAHWVLDKIGVIPTPGEGPDRRTVAVRITTMAATSKAIAHQEVFRAIEELVSLAKCSIKSGGKC